MPQYIASLMEALDTPSTCVRRTSMCWPASTATTREPNQTCAQKAYALNSGRTHTIRNTQHSPAAQASQSLTYRSPDGSCEAAMCLGARTSPQNWSFTSHASALASNESDLWLGFMLPQIARVLPQGCSRYLVIRTLSRIAPHTRIYTELMR